MAQAFARKDFDGRGRSSLTGGLSKWRRDLRARWLERAEGHIRRLDGGALGGFSFDVVDQADNSQGSNSIALGIGIPLGGDLRIEFER